MDIFTSHPQNILMLINVVVLVLGLGTLAYALEKIFLNKSFPFRYSLQVSILILVFLVPLLVGVANTTDLSYVQVSTGVLESSSPVVENFKFNFLHPSFSEEAFVLELDKIENEKYFATLIYLGLLVVWLSGTVFYLCRIIWGCICLLRLRKDLQPISNEISVRARDKAVDYFQLSKTPALYQCQKIPAPFVMGLWNPIIVLPTGLESDVEAEQIEAVLLHEVAHISHRDQWMGLFQRLVLALFWWCPLLYMVNKKINELRESICDNYVVNVQGSGFCYAQTLIEMAERLLIGRYRYLPSTIGLMGTDKDSLTLRISNLLKKERNTMTRMNSLAILATALLFIVVSSLTVFSSLTAHEENTVEVEKKKEHLRRGHAHAVEQEKAHHHHNLVTDAVETMKKKEIKERRKIEIPKKQEYAARERRDREILRALQQKFLADDAEKKLKFKTEYYFSPITPSVIETVKGDKSSDPTAPITLSVIKTVNGNKSSDPLKLKLFYMNSAAKSLMSAGLKDEATKIIKMIKKLEKTKEQRNEQQNKLNALNTAVAYLDKAGMKEKAKEVRKLAEEMKVKIKADYGEVEVEVEVE